MMEKFGFSGRSSHPTPPPRPQVEPAFPVLTMQVDNAPGPSFAVDNVLAVPPGTFQNGQYVIVNDTFVFTARVAPQLQGTNSIGAGGAQREWGQWSLREPVKVTGFDIFASGHGRVYLGSMDVEIDFYSRNKAVTTPYDQEVLAKRMLALYRNQVFSPGQKLAMEMSGMNFRVTILSTQVVDLGQASDPSMMRKNARGILVESTDINFFKPAGGLMNIKAAANKPRVNAILQPNFRFEDMGIGGLDEEFNTIFRRAFASRIYPPRDVEKLGIKHVKGLLLFGPPGTGKTLIARQIGKMLNAVEPKIVNGPEMLNKYVGGSEENVRNLFKDAEAEYKEKGDESSLHIIIFDELDAVFKQRGSRGDGTGVGDNVVNQLLAKMDGVDQLNNILVIGMTNRRDLIDVALLRPGRFEVQLEISLPDEKGRRQIFKIHTAKMRTEKKLQKDVSIEELASMTKNFSGAEIEGLVKSAASFALNRNVRMDLKKGITFDNKEVMVTRDDFLKALDENKPAFGVSEDELSTCMRGGIIKYSPYVTNILSQGDKFIQQVRQSDQFPLISVLVHGPPGSGKTALAASIALSSGFPFIKLISPDAMIGMSEANRVQYLSQQFQDSYKSPLNVLVIDQIEDILDWVNIGPRFSNSVLQTLKVFLRKVPPKDRRLIVFATTCQRDILDRMDVLKSFNKEIYVPNVSSVEDLNHVFEEANFLDSEARTRAIDMIQQETASSVLGVGIKNVLFNIEAAKLSGKGNELTEFVELTVRDINNKPGKYRPEF
jgi:vesicle-fusing ATPase